MAIESPQTYADWYWAMSLDALRARAEDYEKTLAPIANTLITNLPDIVELPAHCKAVLDAISAPLAPELDNVVFRFLAQVGGGIAQRILGHELKDFDYALNTYLKNVRITPEVANALKLRNKITDDLWLARQNAGGFSEVEAAFAYEAQKPYPTLPDIITYARYHGDPLNPKEIAWSKFDISEADFDLWDWLSWQKLTTDQVLSLFRRRYFTEGEAKTELARLGWHTPDTMAVMDLSYILPNAMLLVQGNLLQEQTQDNILKDISSADIHPAYAQTYLDGILTKPAVSDIINYELRKDPKLSNLDRELRKIGIHPNYFSLFKELAYQIPPLADIVTMAVREAFTPEIAARFGQYEGLPADFVTWAMKKGLSKEWAERYWAAHWTLPSAQQGFEMLHRNIISRDDLLLLLRALDVMPFWRDRLIEMAYSPLTRIDVRRMYRLGVLSAEDVTKAYMDLGYNSTNAKRLTEFVVIETRQSLSRFSSNDVVRAFTRSYIDEGQAITLLANIGIKDTEIPNIIQSAIYKRDWALKQERIDAVENLYKKGRYTETQTRSELGTLNLPFGYIDSLIKQWQLKVKAEAVATWTTTQTLTFLRKGIITPERAIQEFQLLGYDTERIKVYLASAAK